MTVLKAKLVGEGQETIKFPKQLPLPTSATRPEQLLLLTLLLLML